MDKVKIVYMDCRGRNGLIPPSKSDSSMNVGELIEWLKKYDPETPIYISEDGWTYQCIEPNIFSEAFVNVIDEEREINKEKYNREHNWEVIKNG